MIDINKAVIARLKKGGENFEVLVDLDKALDFKKGKVNVEEALAAEYIYKDAKKGMKASEHEMEKFFDATDVKKVAEIIIKNGEMHLTAEHKNKLREEKRKKIIELIRRNAIDSRTGLPHPLIRIENAMEEAKVAIDEFKSAEEQIEDVLDKLRAIIPIKFELKKLQLNIPSKYAGNCYPIIKKFGKVLNESWESNGNLSLEVEIPGGMVEEFYDKLNNLTHGEMESKEK